MEQRCSFITGFGLCLRTSLACQLVSDVALDMSPGWFAPSQSSNSTALFDCRIFSGRSWRAVCNGPHARMRTCRIACALPARLLLCRTPVSPVHGIKTHVSHIQNVRTMRRSEYLVPLIHHMRPLNHRETSGNRNSWVHDSGELAASDRAISRPGTRRPAPAR